MDNLKSVYMLIGRFFPVQGGAEVQCLLLSKELKAKGINVTVITQALSGRKSVETIEGVNVRRLGLPFNNRFGSFFYTISAFLFLVSKTGKNTLLHAHIASSPAVLAGILSLLTGAVSLLKIAGSRKTGDIYISSLSWHGRFKLWFLKKTITAFVCPSLETEKEAIDYGFPEGRTHRIPNGVDTKAFQPGSVMEKEGLRKSLNLPSWSAGVVYSGRLAKGKGLELLLEAWKEVSLEPQCSSAALFIIGGGPLENALKEQYAGLKNLRFEGFRQNVKDYLKACDIYVLPSLGEGLSNSLLEAMSCGLICVSTRIGGVTELIMHENNGLLVPPNDKNALVSALKNSIINKNKLAGLGLKARETMLNGFSIEHIASKYIDLYGGLLK